MNIRKLYAKAQILHSLRSEGKVLKNDTKKRLEFFKQYGIELKKLSQSQKDEVKKVFNDKIKDFSTHELIYSVTGRFDPYIFPEGLFYSDIRHRINDKAICRVMSDKNYSDKLFPHVRFPVTIIRNINGSFYDADYNLISRQEAVNKVSEYEKVCIKPSGGRAGQGVSLVNVRTELEKEFDQRKSDYIVQELLEQHETLKKLNPSSVNIVRVCSLFLNGKVSVVSMTLRCGASGAFNDNSITEDGKGMFVVGVDLETGKLFDKGYYSCGVSLDKAPNGQEFAGLQLPDIKKMISVAEHMHSQMPFAGFVGFDIAFDKNGEPVVMEYNLNKPGAYYYQITSGPLFGERTQEVIDTFLK